MKKLKEALQLLHDLGLPERQQNERSALSLLALANVKPKSNWTDAKQISMSVAGNKDGKGKYPGIMQFINEHYHKVRTYKETAASRFGTRP